MLVPVQKKFPGFVFFTLFFKTEKNGQRLFGKHFLANFTAYI